MSAAGLQALERPRRLLRLALPSIRLSNAGAWCGYLFLLSPILIVVPMSLGGSSQMEFPPHQLSLRLYAQYFASPGWRAATLQSLMVATSATVFAPIKQAQLRRFDGERYVPFGPILSGAIG